MREEGKAEGIAIGEERGIEKGKMETACKMLKKGVDPLDISEFTGLSVEQIKSLKNTEK